MKRMKLSELTGNEILAQSLMTWDYQIILPEVAFDCARIFLTTDFLGGRHARRVEKLSHLSCYIILSTS